MAGGGCAALAFLDCWFLARVELGEEEAEERVGAIRIMTGIRA